MDRFNLPVGRQVNKQQALIELIIFLEKIVVIYFNTLQSKINAVLLILPFSG